MNGKGDTPRPTDIKRFRKNYDAIDWGHNYRVASTTPRQTLKSKRWTAKVQNVHTLYESFSQPCQ